MCEKFLKYFSKHITYALTIHFLGGIGVGIIIARPVAADHPVRWGATLIIIAILGYLYPLWAKK